MAGSLTSSDRYAAAALLALALREAQRARKGELELEEKEEWALKETARAGDFSWCSQECGILENTCRCLLIEEDRWSSLERLGQTPDTKLQVSAFLHVLKEGEGSNSGAEDDKSPGKAALELSGQKVEDTVTDDKSPAQLSARSAPLNVDKTVSQQALDRLTAMQHTSPSPSTAVFQDSPEAPQETKSEPQKTSTTQGETPTNPDDAPSTSAPVPRKPKHCMLPPDAPKLSPQRTVAVVYELLYAAVSDGLDYGKKGGKVHKRPGYDARQRVALRFLAEWLDLPWKKVTELEVVVAHAALAAETARREMLEKEREEDAESEKNRKSWAKWKRNMYVGGAAVAGGALLAVTGGLAAPAIGAGIAALTTGSVAATAALATTTAGTAVVAGAFGAAGAGLGGYRMSRRVGDVSEFQFEPVGENHQQGCLAVGVYVAGVCFEPQDYVSAWEAPDRDLERFVVRWESKEVIPVATAVQDWIKANLTAEIVKKGAMMTVLQGLLLAVAWPAAIVGALNGIENKWAVVINRADKAGVLLADALLSGSHGDRPVTLVGASLGARVVFSCLEELARRGDTGGIVERAVLLGMPLPHDVKRWETVRGVVAGRLVNGYATNDWTLGVIYRANLMTTSIAGLQPCPHTGVENVDVTPWVKGHTSYLHHLREIQAQVDVDSCWPVGVLGLPEAESVPAGTPAKEQLEAADVEAMAAQAGNLTL
ncbi:hypothetical protein KFL_000930090 [Klebsormidium nitens]|uniref:Uncharacterized protein n=1 Tax=Klebsormidium nitens TaxID=105231 RepID=A0A1Y1HUP8_KLENI|nr:hypothetical protein KFL_000930090 [Klebsormidium nitens]|eukprot:GAQ81863.1 hypothetical protein KFL_000930090 [Klebsormidium nitens]